MEKCYAKDGHISQGGGVLGLQNIELPSASHKPLMLNMQKLTSLVRLRNHPTKSV